MKLFLSRVSSFTLLAVLATSAHAGIFSHTQKTPTKPNPDNPLAGNTSKQPDKELFDKAMDAMRRGKYDVARLDLQTLLNTYPESEYQMRAKLAVGDSWFKEGGSAALTQAEAEYKDFITFFPNQPEAAEAQMKVADIYDTQMEKPDRDPTNAERAEQEYRTMIQQFPDSPLVPRAKQRLREVQEVLAERQFEIGTFYASHENWAATIARLSSVADSYPLFSHSDLTLIGLGDAYAGEARFTQTLNIAPKAKQEIMKTYDDRAAAAYAEVVTHYAESPHVEDARERLIALNRPVPEPTPQELAASETEEQSRAAVTFKDRALFLLKRGPVTVTAARVGEPTLVDATEVIAPNVTRGNQVLFEAAMNGKPIPEGAGTGVSNTTVAAAATPAADADSGTPLQLEDVPAAEARGQAATGIGASIVGDGSGSSAGDASQAPPRTTSASATDPGASAGASAGTGGGASPAANPAAASGGAIAADAAGVPGAQNPGGLAAVGPTNNQPLPAVEKPAEAPAQVNDVQGNNPAQVQTGTAAGVKNGKKTPAPKYDSSEESSSKHKKKKGLKKLDPF